MNTAEILTAMRADQVPEGESGLWRIHRRESKVVAPHRTFLEHPRLTDRMMVPPGRYTFLTRLTTQTLHSGGETVMEDTPQELSKHLDFVLRAHGRVLVTGLGLGCIARGLLLNERVTELHIVEREKAILKLVAPQFAGNSRIRIHHASAIRWLKKDRSRWDCAWHDLWSDPDREEPHLAIIHQQLMLGLVGRCQMQGAWAFPRYVRRLLNGYNCCQFI